MTAAALQATGAFLMAAVAAEKARTPAQARRLILDQFAYVEGFIAANSEDYALARTPAEARKILLETDKMVIIHSIEGDPRESAAQS